MSGIGRLPLFFFMGIGAAAAAETDVREGMWETVIAIQIKGSIFPFPAIKSTKCLTRADLVPNATEGRRCKVMDQKVEGNDVTWRVQCVDEKGTMEGKGKITYAGTTFRGGMDIFIHENEQGREMEMRYLMNGTWAGKCK